MPMMRERLANYLAASGTKVERDEIGWLVAEWGSGPGLVVLDPAHSWQRAGEAVLEALIDIDGDGMLSEQEISGAEDMLNRTDLDANGVVEMSEIRRANRREPRFSYNMANSLIVMLDSNTDWDALATILASVYTPAADAPEAVDAATPIKERVARGDATLTADALRTLVDEPADVSLRVDFGGGENAKSGVSLVAASPEFTSAENAVAATEDVITVDLGSDYLEISAASVSNKSNLTTSESQIAVGAVIDGNPLLRVLDQDQDQRLTLRERQELKELLTSLDYDSNGQLAAAEMPIPIRLAISLGPHVHELLAKPTGAARPIAPNSEPAPPDWFASMDKNNDRDLSREEFLGTSDQFKLADADGDGLLNVAEAVKLGGGK
jgi:Ca2+-binding EF-hand superfamily protein